jgi:death-on-curing protein
MEVFLVLNGYEIDASVDEQERVMLDVASAVIDRAGFTHWLESHIARIP